MGKSRKSNPASTSVNRSMLASPGPGLPTLEGEGKVKKKSNDAQSLAPEAMTSMLTM